MGKIDTIRDKDWNELKNHFYISYPIKKIEYEKIKLARTATLFPKNKIEEFTAH